MVIADLNLEGITVDEPEADSPLIVDGDRVLALTVACESMKAVPRRNFEILQPRGEVHILKLAGGSSGDIGGKPFGPPPNVQFPSASIRERLDHLLIVTCRVTRVNPPPREARVNGERGAGVMPSPVPGRAYLDNCTTGSSRLILRIMASPTRLQAKEPDYETESTSDVCCLARPL